MEKIQNNTSNNRVESDLNGNVGDQHKHPELRKEIVEVTKNGVSTGIKDHITTDDGRVFYPCRFCNKVFSIKKTRTAHIRQCPAKDYILSVDDDTNKDDSSKEIPQPGDKESSVKIDIQQNIVLKNQLDVDQILSKSKSPPIKLTIRRNPSNGKEIPNHFTVSSSLVLKEKNEPHDEFNSIAKRLESNSVTITKQPKEENGNDVKVDNNGTTCRECNKDFDSPLDLLRHSRKCHTYPKVLMALSEVKKFYTVKDRSECPICHKPLKTNFRSAFVKHLHIHTNEMKYSCTVCNRKFRRSDHMKAHEKRHILSDKK